MRGLCLYWSFCWHINTLYGCHDITAVPEQFYLSPYCDFLPVVIKCWQCARECIVKRRNISRSDSYEWAKCSGLKLMSWVSATATHPLCLTTLWALKPLSCSVEMSAPCYKATRNCCEKFFSEARRHTELKLCVDRTGSIPTVCLNINSTCWNGKYAIDLCALELYSNISIEWQNKRGTVCHTRGDVQHKEDS